MKIVIPFKKLTQSVSKSKSKIPKERPSELSNATDFNGHNKIQPQTATS